jgi:ABC-type multidrug transport system ATPase subunit
MAEPPSSGAPSSGAATPALEARALTKTYGDLPASGPLDLTVAPGERVVLLGHNGSGKTTFLRMAAGLIEPTGGSVTVHGHAVGSMPARAATSFLGDTPVFYDDLSVWEHLEYLARLHDTQDWEQHAADLLDALGLTARADHLPTTFSRGLRQKAAIAVAFVRPFELLLVDEPFVGLDLTGRDALLELFRAAHRDGAALVIATHELTTVAESERVVALRDGEVIYDGPAADADVDALVVH